MAQETDARLEAPAVLVEKDTPIFINCRVFLLGQSGCMRVWCFVGFFFSTAPHSGAGHELFCLYRERASCPLKLIPGNQMNVFEATVVVQDV